MRVSDLFTVTYGNSLELNALKEDPLGINFVSRTRKNNGVSAKIARIPDIEPNAAGCLSVALSATPLETFVQMEPFYTGFHVAVLTPKRDMPLEEKLWWVACIRAHQYRYSYGRQANRTLKDLELPDAIPEWAKQIPMPRLDASRMPTGKSAAPVLNEWSGQFVKVRDLFDIKRGQNLDLNALNETNEVDGVNYVSCSGENNGVTATVALEDGVEPSPAGTITIALAGSALETFLQPAPYYCAQNISVLTPKRPMSTQEKLWWVACIRAHLYRFSFGRKANNTHKDLLLPDFVPDWVRQHEMPDLAWLE